MVPVVSAEKASFEYSTVTLYFSWPEGLEIPDVDLKFYKDHDEDAGQTGDRCDVHIEIERSEPLGEDEEDTDPTSIYWTVQVPALVPKDSTIGKTNVAITRPPLDAEVQKFKKKLVGESNASEPFSLKKAATLMGAQAVRAQASRSELQGAGKQAEQNLPLPAGMSKDIAKRAKHLLK
jgi:hypothetical protein